MSDEKSIFPRIEIGYAHKTDMKDEIVKNFNKGRFTQGSAILKIKYYNPKNQSFNMFLLKKGKINM